MNDYNIKYLYERMEIDLITSMQRNLKRHLKEEDEVGFKFPQWQAEKLKELKRYQRQNKSIIGEYTRGLSKKISKRMQEEVRQGSIEAIKQYNKVTKNRLKPDKLMNKSFFKTNERKVNSLIKVVNNDLKTANTGVLRMVNDQYRQVIHKSAFFAANGVMTEKQAIDMANKDFLSRGLNCIEYSNGRRVNIASYSEMAVRTASLRAHLMGEGDFRKSLGRTLVKVTSHGGACKICSNWQGKVLVDDVYSGGKSDGKHQLLSEAMKQGFLHPNCRHGLTTYYPELEGIKYDEPEEEIDDDLQEQINYYDRQEKRFNRLSIGSLDSENKKTYNKKRIACENKKEILIIKANNDFKYNDVTDELLKKATPNFDEIPEVYEYKNYNISNAKFDTKDITYLERNSTKQIQSTIGGRFRLLHRVQKDGQETPDAEYVNKLIFKGTKYFDVKSPKKSRNANSKKKKISRQLDEVKHQSNNVIISLLRKECDLSNQEAEKQLIECLNNKRYSDWLENVFLVGKNDYLRIYTKKKKP